MAPHLLNEIEPFALQKLREASIDPTRFQWMLPVTSIGLATGGTLDGGWVAKLADGTICIFRYGKREGFQIAKTPQANPTATCSPAGNITLLLSFPQPSAVTSCTVAVGPSVCMNGTGPWLDYWRTAIEQATKLEGSDLIAFVDVETVVPASNQFGPKIDRRPDPVLLAVRGDTCITFPDLKLTPFGDLPAWCKDETSLEFHGQADGIPRALRVTPRAIPQGLSLLDTISGKLPSERQATEPARASMRNQGVFRPAGQGNLVLLRKTDPGEIQFGEGSAQRYRFVCTFGATRTAIATQDGESLMLQLDAAQAATAFAGLLPLADIALSSDSGARWILATAAGAPDTTLRLSLTGSGLSLGDTAPLVLSAETNITAAATPDRLLALTVTAPFPDGQTTPRSYTTTESLGYAFWAEFDAQKTALGVASAGISDLYRQFNEAKKYNVLLVMFGDIMILNRALDAGLPMRDLVRKLEDVGAVAFAENSDLRDATVKKILTLSVALPEIKQRFEMLAAMAPYYWASTETDWLAATFAGVTGTPSAATERKRIVPRVRRQLRVVQGDLLRCLSQIEACIRPLESMLAKDEVRQSRSARIARYAPVAVQVGIGLTAIMTGGAGLMAANLLGGALATHGLGNVLAFFQKDREAAAQIRKVAEQVLPWWDVFMRTLVVSIFETAEFVDDENLLAMQRDKKLLLALPEDAKQQLLKTMQGQLRKRIVAERRNRFGEVLDGSGIRLNHIIADMEHAIGPGMRGTVDEFVGNVIVSGRKAVQGGAQ
ncbi:MAG: hypothetical protein K8T26_19860 [Lentisphaerae bacterium]|nr:hypothetical protein [Lentisphaerota bacterium]